MRRVGRAKNLSQPNNVVWSSRKLRPQWENRVDHSGVQKRPEPTLPISLSKKYLRRMILFPLRSRLQEHAISYG